MVDHDIRNFKVNKGTTDSYEMLVDGNVDIIDGVEFAKKQIVFCDKKNPELSFLHILLKVSELHGWTIGEIDGTPKEYLYYEDGELKKKYTILSDEIGSFDVKIQDLYSFLTQDAPVQWNFQKFMIDENGNWDGFVAPKESPFSETIISWIEKK